MTFEGKQVNIPIMGIMRAGTDNLCADGAMNEVIGMEYKDGSWLPYKESRTIWKVMKVGVSTITVDNIAKVYIHKTSDTDSHLVFLLNDGVLMYEESVSEESHIIYVRNFSLSGPLSGVKSVSFVGNMLCVATDKGIEHYIWKEEGYSKRHEEYPHVELRTTLGLQSETSEDRIGLVYCQKVLGAKTSTLTNIAEDRVKSIARSGLTAALGEVRDRGGLTGYIIACVAYRLKNGEFVKASAPILLGRPSIANGTKEYNLQSLDHLFNGEERERGEDNFCVYERFWMPVDIDRNEDELRKDGFNELEIRTGNDGEYCAVCGTPSPFNPINTIVLSKTLGRPGSDAPSTAEEWQLWQSGGSFSYTSDSYMWYPLAPTAVCSLVKDCLWYQGNFRVDNYFNSIVTCNKLQYRIKDIPDNISTGDVQSVCIFISQEISPYYFDELDEDDDVISQSEKQKGLLLLSDNGSGVLDEIFGVRSIYAKYKRNDSIVKELKEQKSLYCVKEIYLDEISASDNWITIDLKGILGASLVTREQLPITVFSQEDTIANRLDAYNYRLHQFDYKQELFKGYGIKDFYHTGGKYQFPVSTGTGPGFKWEIKVDIVSDEGIHSVVTYSPESVTSIIRSLSPILSYPSIYATSMTIRMYGVLGGEWVVNETVYPLTPIRSLGISCYIDPDLKPIIVLDSSAEEFSGEFPSMEPSDNVKYYHNGLKVSDVSYPSYFPAAYTYRIGNEKIIGLAHFSIPASQDQYGGYAMAVFCTDGIYTMDVDTSGNGVYTNIRYFHPEVCVNPNSICEIGGAVIFASDKGLMILTPNGVEEFTPQLNGPIRFKPTSAGVAIKDGQHIYNKMVTHSDIVQLSGSLSTQDFIDYLQDKDAHGNCRTVVSYVSNKNKIVVYNQSKPYIYLIDIATRNTTKLNITLDFDDDNSPTETYWAKVVDGDDVTYSLVKFGNNSQDGTTECLIQSRPIKIQQDDKCSFRVVLTGYFEGEAGKWAELVVLGSLDGSHWRALGVKEKRLEGGFHNLGCVTDRGAWRYLMFIFAGSLSNKSHIDSIDITVEGKYNNKKR